MRTRAVLTSVFASVGVLVVGWQLGAAAATQATVSAASAAKGGAGATSVLPAPSASPTPTVGQKPASAPVAAAAHKSADGTFTGASVDTVYGSVQVQVTVSGGSITAVTALHLTDADGRSVQISNRAAPTLAREVLAAQSAKVSNVSGATYTSEAYLSSVQSALDQSGR